MFPEAVPDLQERLAVMLRQEATTYRCEDYLSPSFQRTQIHESKSIQNGTRQLNSFQTMPSGNSDASVVSAVSSSSSSATEQVSEDWRTKISEWTYQVIDHFDYDREIAAISLSYLDRYLCRQPVNKKSYQLAGMASLYLACKLDSPNKLRMSTLIELSRGYFTEEHIIAMEEAILNKLQWQVNPPTPYTFCQHLALLFPPNCMSTSVWHDMLEVAKFLTELSVMEYYFATRRPSSVGIAALLTAMEGIDEHRLSTPTKQAFMDNALRITGIDSSSQEVEECRERLRAIYYEGGVYQQQKEAEAAALAAHCRAQEANRISSVSPVSVAGAFDNGMGQHMSNASYVPS